MKRMWLFVKIYNEEEYVLFVGEEARDKAVEEQMEDSLHYLSTPLLTNHLKFRLDHSQVDMLKSIEHSDLIKALLVSFDDLVREALHMDGAGHYLASYDGIEHECFLENEYSGHTLYYYRVC